MRPSGRGRRPPAAGHSAHGLRWLMGFGTLGLFAVSVIDSSIIPLPVPGSTDLLLILLVAHRGRSRVCGRCGHRGVHSGRVFDLGYGGERWRSGAPSLSAQAICAAPVQVGREEWHGCRHRFGVASPAFSADALVACCGRFRGFAEEIPDFFQSGENLSLFAGSVACRYLRPGVGSCLSPLPVRLEHHPHVDLFGVGGGWYLVRPVEVPPPGRAGASRPQTAALERQVRTNSEHPISTSPSEAGKPPR